MEIKQCARCVMNSTAGDISFDKNGFCNYCSDFLKKTEKIRFNAEERHKKIIDEIKKAGRGKEYDCAVGVSGGVDSSYALYLAKKNGLRPLAVHLDNSWNSELANNNIERLVKTLNVDLYTHVIDWEEFRDMQLSFFKANVIDIELLSDNALFALNYIIAAKNGIKYILGGTNTLTEGMPLPESWVWYKFDARNIRKIHKKFGNRPIKTFPIMGTIERMRYRYLKKIKWINFLDYFNYNKNDAVDILKTEVGYRPYEQKHYESVFTRFYQGYILPEKFNVDKRLVHFSTLICTGQLTRAEALKMLEIPPYSDKDLLNQDIDFFLKKMDWTEEELKKYIEAPGVPHEKYGSEILLYKTLLYIYGMPGIKGGK